MADEFRTDGDLIVPGDECMACGERAEAHIKFNDVGEIEREPWWCDGYRRSPLSAFRGPAVRFTREEAAGWLVELYFEASRRRDIAYVWIAESYFQLRDDPRADTRKIALWLVKQAQHWRDAVRPEFAIAALYLAARILRAVRP